jgi:hypothetical protein
LPEIGKKKVNPKPGELGERQGGAPLEKNSLGF